MKITIKFELPKKMDSVNQDTLLETFEAALTEACYNFLGRQNQKGLYGNKKGWSISGFGLTSVKK